MGVHLIAEHLLADAPDTLTDSLDERSPFLASVGFDTASFAAATWVLRPPLTKEKSKVSLSFIEKGYKAITGSITVPRIDRG